ncbi:hypothetical protein FRB94_005936, partial [Tulasnella sp. JGI-2019a]
THLEDGTSWEGTREEPPRSEGVWLLNCAPARGGLDGHLQLPDFAEADLRMEIGYANSNDDLESLTPADVSYRRYG